MNIFDVLEQAARRFPDRPALCTGTDTIRDFAALRERCLRLAASIAAATPPAARIALASENRVEVVEAMFGTWAAGRTLVPINAKLHPREMSTIVEDAGASLVIASAALAPGLAQALAEGPCASVPRVVVGSADWRALLEAPPARPVDLSPDALAWLFYTSGTTGRSKGAMLTHRNLIAMTVSHLADVESVDEGDCLLHAAPMSHGSGLYAPVYLARGARQVVPASGTFDAAEVLALCDTLPRVSMFLAPTMVQRLRTAAQAAGRGAPRGLRTIVYGGGPMYVEELKRAREVFGPVFVQIYGQGESPMTITWLRRDDHGSDEDAVLGSVGWARTGIDVAIVDRDGGRLPDGEIGEVVVRGATVMAGYWNQPEATGSTLRDGWLWTGDMGSLDERGYLTLRDRSKDVVISGASNIYPREVEEALLGCPGVDEACVVGAPDPEWGEVVVAFVVARPGVDAAMLDAHCLERIARFKRPKRYVFVDALPKNSYGKVLKRELRARL